MAKKKTLLTKKTNYGDLLGQAISATGVAEVVRASATNGTVKALYRVYDKRAWLTILEYVLSKADGWSAHVCQQYFMRGGKLIYGWNFILQIPEGGEETVLRVASLIAQATKVIPKTVGNGGPLESFPLVGASRARTAKNIFDPRLPGPDRGGPSHKGAYSVTENG